MSYIVAISALLSILFIFFSSVPQLGVLLLIMSIMMKLYQQLTKNEEAATREAARHIISRIKGSKVVR